MKKKTNVTIHDIAKELNVSSSTVSRALKGHHSIGEATTKAVKKLAEELGYRPNHLAVNLRKQQSTSVGVIVPHINRPFISSLVSGIEHAAREAGYNVLISQSSEIHAIEMENASAFYNSRVCGLLVSIATETSDFEHINKFKDSGIPVVFVDRIPELEDIYKVMIDNRKATFEATEHLIKQGCRRIAHYGGPPTQLMYRERRQGYLDALVKYGLQFEEALMPTANKLTAEEGFILAEQVLSLPNRPDGILASNDISAVSTIQYAKSKDIKIPEELAIIGFNNDPMCTIVEPNVSSVNQPGVDMGRLAAQTLFKIMSEDSLNVPKITILDTQVVPRASSLRKG
ncbi:MAG: substrate-binding domain-containing protein [Bacteroidetes bacterium]|nr:substrate-binding domain-containing protein [Bacteroidota bacterium]